MKPDWKDAPEWAGYLALDADGLWQWFERIPSQIMPGFWRAHIGRTQSAGRQDHCWALEPRP